MDVLDEMQQNNKKKELNDVIFFFFFLVTLSTRILLSKRYFACLIHACWNLVEQVKLTEMVEKLLIWSNCAASWSVVIVK